MTAIFPDRNGSKLTGYFFIIAAISSIIALKLYDPVLTHEHPLFAANQHGNQLIFGALNELLLAISAMGTSIMLFPLLKTYSERMALGYLTFRLLEVLFILIGMVAILVALAISQDYAQHNYPDQTHAAFLIEVCKRLHKWCFTLGPNFMLAINTFIYSFVLLKLRSIPPVLAKWGIISAHLILVAAILELFGIIQQISIWGILLALPIALYEMILAFLLIIKGFRKS